MATITENLDRVLVLDLSSEERATFDGLTPGQLAEFITIWLDERFKEVWTARIERLTEKQKRVIIEYLAPAVAVDVIPGDLPQGEPPGKP